MNLYLFKKSDVSALVLRFAMCYDEYGKDVIVVLILMIMICGFVALSLLAPACFGKDKSEMDEEDWEDLMEDLDSDH